VVVVVVAAAAAAAAEVVGISRVGVLRYTLLMITHLYAHFNDMAWHAAADSDTSRPVGLLDVCHPAARCKPLKPRTHHLWGRSCLPSLHSISLTLVG